MHIVIIVLLNYSQQSMKLWAATSTFNSEHGVIKLSASAIKIQARINLQGICLCEDEFHSIVRKEQHAHCHISVLEGAGLLFSSFCYKPVMLYAIVYYQLIIMNIKLWCFCYLLFYVFVFESYSPLLDLPFHYFRSFPFCH